MFVREGQLESILCSSKGQVQGQDFPGVTPTAHKGSKRTIATFMLLKPKSPTTLDIAKNT